LDTSNHHICMCLSCNLARSRRSCVHWIVHHLLVIFCFYLFKVTKVCWSKVHAYSISDMVSPIESRGHMLVKKRVIERNNCIILHHILHFQHVFLHNFWNIDQIDMKFVMKMDITILIIAFIFQNFQKNIFYLKDIFSNLLYFQF